MWFQFDTFNSLSIKRVLLDHLHHEPEVFKVKKTCETINSGLFKDSLLMNTLTWLHCLLLLVFQSGLGDLVSEERRFHCLSQSQLSVTPIWSWEVRSAISFNSCFCLLWKHVESQHHAQVSQAVLGPGGSVLNRGRQPPNERHLFALHHPGGSIGA